MSWLLLQPVDVVKTCVQSLHPEDKQTIGQVVRRHLDAEGPGFFMRGFAATMLRTFPVSAVTFLVYENCMDFLGERKDMFDALDDAIRNS